MTDKINVGIIFGGKSAEHEVSLQSAKNVVAALDGEKYNPVLIKIEKEGKWLLGNREIVLASAGGGAISPVKYSSTVIPPEAELFNVVNIDVAFPVLHGTFGEDGTVQGLLKLANIPFVGASVLGSAVGMDKDVMNRLLREANVPIAKFKAFTRLTCESFEMIADKLGVPFFVKPANLGSSVGIHKVHDETEFKKAIDDAFQYDNKIVIEEFVKGRELECSVLGNENPMASVVGEVIPQHEFYSYEAKYLDDNGALFKVPAELDVATNKKVQELAIKTFQTLCCEGMGRVDFFLKDNGEVLVNEINTIPGFTKISMYPRLWQASGVSYSELIDRLIQLALERFQKEQKLKTNFI